MRINNGLGQTLDVLAFQLDPIAQKAREEDAGGLWEALENAVYGWTGGMFGRAPIGIIPPPVANPPVPITSPYYCKAPLVWDSYLAGCVNPNQVPTMATQLSQRTSETQKAINEGYKRGSESAYLAGRAEGIANELDRKTINWGVMAGLTIGSLLLMKTLGKSKGRRR